MELGGEPLKWKSIKKDGSRREKGWEWPAAEMADKGGSGGGMSACNERCGCPYPCPGGAACRCKTEGGEVHQRCSCGEHCGCNPCTCSNAVVGVGRANCRCGDACRCVSCSS